VNAPAARLCDLSSFGCGNATRGCARLCTDCFVKLPGFIRLGISEAHYERRWNDWHELKVEAAAFLNLKAAPSATAPAAPSITPQQAFAMTARILGERED
jgi:hypothetical protein